MKLSCEHLPHVSKIDGTEHWPATAFIVRWTEDDKRLHVWLDSDGVPVKNGYNRDRSVIPNDADRWSIVYINDIDPFSYLRTRQSKLSAAKYDKVRDFIKRIETADLIAARKNKEDWEAAKAEAKRKVDFEKDCAIMAEVQAVLLEHEDPALWATLSLLSLPQRIALKAAFEQGELNKQRKEPDHV